MTTQPTKRPEKVVSDSSPSPTTPQGEAKAKPEVKATTRVLVVRDPGELAQYATIWDELAEAACEPNVFYESWTLLPALKALGDGHDFEFYLVFAAGAGPESAKPVLNGFFPMERQKRYKGLPAAVLTLWKHIYSMLCTPLVREGQEGDALNTLLDHFASAPDAPALLEWNYLSGEGVFSQALIEVINHRQTLTHVDETWIRAFMRCAPGKSGEDYIHKAFSSKRRKEFKRQENRLAETGELHFATLEPHVHTGEYDEYAALDAFLADFLQLEASGWKGQGGSAFSCNPTHQEFFCTVAKEAYERKRLAMMALQVNGKSIASKCDFFAGDGAFAFKIAYDEEYARFSPGVLVEMEGIRRIHDNPNINWMDSCAVPDHPMINRVWTERRTLQNLVIATGQGRGEFIVSALPLLRWLKSKIRRKPSSKNKSTPQTPEDKESS
jgi:hypothetical protein